MSSASIAALFSLLRNDANLGAVVGTRIYPAPLPQGATLPAITYEQVSEVYEYTQSGFASYRSPRMQFDCWAAGYDAAWTVADLLIAACHTSLVAGATLQVTIEAVIDEYAPDLRLNRIVVDVRVAHKG